MVLSAKQCAFFSSKQQFMPMPSSNANTCSYNNKGHQTRAAAETTKTTTIQNQGARELDYLFEMITFNETNNKKVAAITTATNALLKSSTTHE